MANWQDLKALSGLEEPLKRMARRNPSYYARYAGEDDEFGYKLTTFALWEPFFRFLHEDYFKLQLRGVENIPSEGRALLVGNHSGLLPLDGGMLSTALANRATNARRIRFLVTDWFFTVPGLGDWIQETGQVRATIDNAKKLLEREEIVGIYPEGIRGVAKTFPQRYRVLDFHPGFVQLAIATQTPIIPIATIGGDEIYPNFANLKSISQLLHMPFFPITPTFPWLPFPLMFFPLPVRWVMNVHRPIELGYPSEKASDRKLVMRIAREIQYEIQRDLNKLLRERKSLFTGWDEDEEH